MGSIASWFGGASVSVFVERARKRLAAGKLEDAAKIVERGLERFPSSNSLRDLRLSLKRARAHKTMRRLEARIENTREPFAYEKLIELYLELELPEEAHRKAEEYCEAHPHRDSPHLLLGSMDLDTFLEDLTARHGHAAYGHLVKAANLNAMSLPPRLLLAELFFCVGADTALAGVRESLRTMGADTPAMHEALRIMDELAGNGGEERLDGLFERIELQGELMRDPVDWPLSKRSGTRAEVDEHRAENSVAGLVDRGSLDEVVLLRRDGTLMAHGAGGDAGDETFVEIVRTVSRKVFPQAREFDMGKFKRCTIRGKRGNIVVGRVGNVMAGVRGASSSDPLRMWERLEVEVESACRGDA